MPPFAREPCEGPEPPLADAGAVFPLPGYAAERTSPRAAPPPRTASGASVLAAAPFDAFALPTEELP